MLASEPAVLCTDASIVGQFGAPRGALPAVRAEISYRGCGSQDIINAQEPVAQAGSPLV
jgi:hypothetical protein